jgi:stage V sporulation protein R
LLDNVLVVAHALGHCDFFKNNIHFSKTNREMMDKLATNGKRIEKIMDRWGKDKVIKFIDHVLRLDTLVDPTCAFKKKKKEDIYYTDQRNYYFPRKFKIDPDRNYMEDWINNESWMEKEHDRIRKREAADALELFSGPEKDVLGYLRDYAPLKQWQADIVAMLHEEALYFVPQRATKMLNEGWASKVDYEMMAKEGLASLGQKGHDHGIVEYAEHKANVLGGKYSTNPYKLGFYLLEEIEERWNKGQFGTEWEECDNLREKKDWDKELGLGKEKIFQVRECYDDYTALLEFFTPEFCEKMEFFEYEKNAKGDLILSSRDFKSIKTQLLQQYSNGGLPDIRLVDPNHRGKGWFLLEHQWEGKTLHEGYAKSVLSSIRSLWGNTVLLATRNKDDEEMMCICDGPAEKDVLIISREEYEEAY